MNDVRHLDDLATRARRFVDDHCIPFEEQAESSGGKLPHEIRARIADEARAAGLVGPDHRPEPSEERHLGQRLAG